MKHRSLACAHWLSSVVSYHLVRKPPRLKRFPFSGRHGIEDLARIENIETRISTALRDHITFTSEAHIKSNYFSKILSNLPELRTIGEQGYRLVMQQIQKIPYGQIPLEVKELETKLNEFNFLPSSSSYGVMDSNSNIQNIESLYNTLPSVSDTIPYLQQTHRLWFVAGHEIAWVSNGKADTE